MSEKTQRNFESWLYPPFECAQSGLLDVGDGHQVYWEESGNPAGLPVVFVHGGPGGGADEKNRRYFDPTRYRIVLFEQRGCGRSTPHACLENNTTWDLVADMEKIREHLKISKWVVFGGSWGSTLSLLYAQTHPSRVLGLILRGIFLLRQKELQWFYQKGASSIFPDAYEPYINFIPEQERGDVMAAYYKRLTSEQESVRLEAATRWSVWEGSTSKLIYDPEAMSRYEDPTFALAFARIECHYFKHGGFLESENQILENMDKIRHLPGAIVQGRYDVVCPMESAWELHRAWPEADFTVVSDAGHSSAEKGISCALVSYTDRFSYQLKKD